MSRTLYRRVALASPVFFRTLTITDVRTLPDVQKLEPALVRMGMSMTDYDVAEGQCPHFDWEAATFVNDSANTWLALALETLTPPFAEEARLTLLSNSETLLREVGGRIGVDYHNIWNEYTQADGQLDLALPPYFPVREPSAHNLRKWLRFARLEDAEWPGQGCHLWDGTATRQVAETVRVSYLILRELYGIKLRASYIPKASADLGGRPFQIKVHTAMGLATHLEINTRSALSHSDHERLRAHISAAAAQSMVAHFLYLRWDLEPNMVAWILGSTPVPLQLAWAHQGLVDAGSGDKIALVMADWLEGRWGKGSGYFAENALLKQRFIESYVRELAAFSARSERSQRFILELLKSHFPGLLPIQLFQN